MQIECKLVVDFWCFCVNNFWNYKYLQKQENLNNSNFLWQNCITFYWDNAWVDISHSTKDGDDICSSFLIMVKTVFFIYPYKNHILYGCHDNKYGQKKSYLSKNIIGTSGYHLMMLWKRYKNVDFSQNLEGIFGMIHQRIRDGIP